MSSRWLLRTGAVAAVTAALAQLVATLLEPDRPDDPVAAIRVVAGSGSWTFDRLLDLVGTLLAIGALAVVGRAFSERPARDWTAAGQPLLALLGALGAGAIVAGAGLKDLAGAWVAAAPAAKPAQLAVFAATSQAADNLFFAAFLVMGLYLATLAAAILTSAAYPRWIAWSSAAAATLVVAGDLLVLASDAAFLIVLLGFALFLVILFALGITMWRRAGPGAAHVRAGRRRRAWVG